MAHTISIDSKPAHVTNCANGTSFGRLLRGSSGLFERVITGLIIGNVGLLLWGRADPVHREFAEHLESVILLVFAAEMLVRLARHRWRLLRQPWVAFDCWVIALALLPVAPVNASALRLVRAVRLLHLSKHVGHHVAGLARGRQFWAAAVPTKHTFFRRPAPSASRHCSGKLFARHHRPPQKLRGRYCDRIHRVRSTCPYCSPENKLMARAAQEPGRRVWL